ncbi:MAG: DNA-binding transcriptional MocR family regulator [Cellvibrionaceae bacterium]|jgi:DNA-binding transcriptional MocR family regulator
MSLFLQISRKNNLAIYRQVAEQIRAQIHTGRLPSGTRLPTVRSLSAELGVTPLTVHSAYNELQADGLIESIVGRGTYVSQEAELNAMPVDMGQPFHPDNILGDILHIMHARQVRSMAVAIPDPDLAPVDEIWSRVNQLRDEWHDLSGYGSIEGDGKLRAALTMWLEERGIQAAPSRLLVTNGAMQALNIVTRSLTQPGDMVLTEEPTFLGFRHLLKTQKLRPLTVELEPDGPNLVQLEQLLKTHQPRFYYTLPAFHNPTGISFSAEKRAAIVELTRKYETIVVEDDVYSDLYYGKTRISPMAACEQSNHVIYLGGFSKSVMSGLRMGFIHASPQLMRKFVAMRRVSDLSGSPMLQRLLAEFLNDGGFKRHMRRVRPIYKQRRDGMQDGLVRFMPSFVNWQKPPGGYCYWLDMPRIFAPGALYRMALENGIGIAAGEAFFLKNSEREFFRLSFGNLTTEAQQAGIEQLGRMIREQADKRPGADGRLREIALGR